MKKKFFKQREDNRYIRKIPQLSETQALSAC